MSAPAGELTRMTAAALAAEIAAGQVGAVEVAQAHLDRIAAVDGDVHAFLHVSGESALAQAQAVDDAKVRGDASASPLAGVPLALKDILVQQGSPATAGSRILQGWIPPYNATVTQRLLDAGIVILGQDQPRRVRDGLVHRELGVRPDAQPVGSEPHPGRFGRRVGRCAGGLRGSAGHRHRHRRVDPAAGVGDRHRRCQAPPTAESRGTG